MATIRTVEECLARARRLTAMADEATDYETTLTYDLLAQEWLELAARISRTSSAPADAPGSPANGAARTRSLNSPLFRGHGHA